MKKVFACMVVTIFAISTGMAGVSFGQEEETNYGYGRVVSVTGNSITVSEMMYDEDTGEEITQEVTYTITQDAELENVPSIDVLEAGKEPAKSHKYGAKKTTVDGIRFDSKKEAARYRELKFQEHCGLISDLELQPEFVLQDGFRHCGKWIYPIKYRGDFRYKNKFGYTIVEDTKGHKTKVYNIKKKMLLKRYPDINFLET